MDKKIRNLLIIVGVLVLCIIAYLIILKLTKEEEPSDNNASIVTNYWTYDNEQIADLTINGVENLSFLYDASTKTWSNKEDNSISINQTAVMSIISQLKQLTYSRVIEEYSSLDEYKLSEPALKIIVGFENGKKLEMMFSDMEGYNASYYFKDNNSDKVYITNSKLINYADYDLYDFISMVEIPDFSSAEIDSYTFITATDERIVIKQNKDLSSDKEIVYDYELLDSDGNEINHGTVNSSDAKIMNNYVNEFMINRVADYSPDDSKLEKYGLLNKKPSVTFEFSGFTTKVSEDANGNQTSQIVECEFTYMITIGNPVSESNGEYYVMVSCIESENETSQYDSKLVYTANALYSEYFLEFDEGNVNGEKIILSELLGEDEIPELTVDNVISVIIQNNESDERIVITNSAENASFSVFKASDPDTIISQGVIDSTAYKQFCAFLYENKNMNVEKSISDKSNDNLIKYGLDVPACTITFEFIATHTDDSGNSKDYELSWSLMIGSKTAIEEEELRYVTTSNTDYIVTMPDSIINYIVSINKNILDGTESYGQSEIGTVK